MKKKPKKRKWTAKEAEEHWAVKRCQNINRMLKEMAKDDAYLFKVVAHVLSDISNIPTSLGDDSGGLLLGGLANLIDNKYRDALRKKSRKKK